MSQISLVIASGISNALMELDRGQCAQAFALVQQITRQIHVESNVTVSARVGYIGCDAKRSTLLKVVLIGQLVMTWLNENQSSQKRGQAFLRSKYGKYTAALIVYSLKVNLDACCHSSDSVARLGNSKNSDFHQFTACWNPA